MRHTPAWPSAFAVLTGMFHAWGQAPPVEGSAGPPIVTVCDVLSAPLEFDGRLVRIRGRMSATDEGVWLFGDGCRSTPVTDGHIWPTAIALATPGERGVLHHVDFKFDEESQHKFDRDYRRLLKRTSENCIVSTITGLFETRRDWSRFKVVYPSGASMFVGFGHLGDSPGQLITKSEDSAEVDPNCHTKRKSHPSEGRR